MKTKMEECESLLIALKEDKTTYTKLEVMEAMWAMWLRTAFNFKKFSKKSHSSFCGCDELRCLD